MAKSKYWWLKEDCRECDYYNPDCPFLEHTKHPRGCSAYRHTIQEDKDINKVIKQQIYGEFQPVSNKG